MNSRRTVLVIDDEPGMRATIAAYLEDNDYQVVQADDGVAGVELFASGKFDVVVTDLRMSRMDGVEVVTWMKLHSPATPVIVLTGTGDRAAQAEALTRGARVCLLKPLTDLADLDRAIERALKLPGAR